MEYFLADLHFGHANVLKYDGRPFKNIEENDKTLINNWNSVVTDKDIVYVLGDISWYNANRTIEIFSNLHGDKVLITGNHDHKLLKSTIRNLFKEIVGYKEIRIDGNKIILSHYPILFYNGRMRGNYHFYGHVHNSLENDYVEQCIQHLKKKGESFNMYNVGCMMPQMGYTPRTFYEITGNEVKR